MEFNQILELIDHVSASELTAFTYETADLTLSMEHGKPQIIQGVMGETVENIPAAGMTGGKVRRAVQKTADQVNKEAQNNQSATAVQESKSQSETVTDTSAPSEAASDQNGSLVTSPLVGTFYAAPSQDLPPYVQVGDKVKKGQVLAIVEAMKLMNEIESEFEGKVAEIYVENGQAVAEFLENHPKVAYVNYSGLPSNKYYERAQKYLPNGGCGVVSFGLKGGREAASAFMKALKLGAIETHVADARTCCLNPATSTHRQMNDEQLKEAGVPAELIRISLGLEDKVDLIADISNALDAIK